MSDSEFSLPKPEEFFKRYGVPKDQFEKAQIDWHVLEEIAKRQHSNRVGLESAAGLIVEHLRQVPAVHSLKLRAKSPEHLVEKIIRKRIEKPDVEITPDNYPNVITDLVGVRALHLFKDQWKPIHDVVTKTWHLQEQPLAYIREGDSKDVQDNFAAAGCDVKEHPHGYRSVHYLIISAPTKETVITELQVRTIFEEGWSEIDHQIRYPYKKGDPLLREYLVMFNRLAGNADEMGTFIKVLDTTIAQDKARFDEVRRTLDEKEKLLAETISKLKLTEEEQTSLQKQVRELKAETLKPYAGYALSNPNSISVGSLSGSGYALSKPNSISVGSLSDPGFVLSKPISIGGVASLSGSDVISAGQVGAVTGYLTRKCPKCGNESASVLGICSNCGIHT
jgi:ppGpp synthetase/RelA/SpoT-type nucleotidyltranferase